MKTLKEILEGLQALSEEEKGKATEEEKKKVVETLGITIPVDNSKIVQDLQATARVQDEKIALLASEMDEVEKERDALKAEKLQGEKAQVIEAALQQGRITPKNRAHWEAMFDKDPKGTRQLLATQEPVIAFGVIGTAAGGEESEVTVEEREMAAKAGISNENMEKYGPKAGKEK